jgi:hypothetical protein
MKTIHRETRRTWFCLHNVPRLGRGAVVLVALILFLVIPRTAFAQQLDYVGPSSILTGPDWSVSANWFDTSNSTFFVPTSSDTVYIGMHLDTSATTVPLGGTSAVAYQLTLDAISTPSVELDENNSADTMTVGLAEDIGVSTSNNTYNQSAGTNTTPELVIGVLNNSTGQYILSGNGNLSATSTGTAEIVGLAGSGTFTQSGLGSENQVSGLLDVGASAGSHGTYLLQNGTIFAGGETVGDAGTGSFTQSGNAYNWVTTLTVGNQGGSTGVYTLNSGALIASTEYIGYENGSNDTAVFNQQGGNNGQITILEGSGGGSGTINNSIGLIDVGYNTGSHGYYLLQYGAITADNEIIGDGGTGSFTQAGDNTTSNTISGTLTVGNASSYTEFPHGHFSGGNGTYLLEEGTLQAGAEVVGANGTGVFEQAGTATNTITGNLDVGENAAPSIERIPGGSAGNGYYVMTGASLSAANEIIGDAGTGSFTQNGGNNAIEGNLTLGNQSSGTGLYTMNSGTLTAALEQIGNNGKGTFIQTGGANRPTNISVAAGSSYTMSSTTGPATLSVSDFTANHGTITITGQPEGSVNLGNYISYGGTLNSDPSSIDFTDIGLDANSVVNGAAGDVYHITGSFDDDSTVASNLSQVDLVFQGGGVHNFEWSSGSPIGEIDLATGSNDTLDFQLSANLYVDSFVLEGGTAELSEVAFSGTGNIYYNPNNAANAYLEGGSYKLADGDYLEAETPEPSTWALLLGGGAILFCWQRRRAAKSPALLRISTPTSGKK